MPKRTIGLEYTFARRTVSSAVSVDRKVSLQCISGRYLTEIFLALGSGRKNVAASKSGTHNKAEDCFGYELKLSTPANQKSVSKTLLVDRPVSYNFLHCALAGQRDGKAFQEDHTTFDNWLSVMQDVVHIWELSGPRKLEEELLTAERLLLPMSSLSTSVVVVVLDLSKVCP